VKSDYGTQGYVSNLKSIHDQVKGRFGGRIKKGQKAVSAKMLVENKDTLKEYVQKRQKAVGAIKSGWYKALISLPRSTDNNGQQGEPGAELRKATWITGHSGVSGYNTSTFTDSNCAVTIANTLGNVNGIADEADTLGLVYGNRVKQMPSQVRYRMQKRVDKFNNK
jgi:hypothetical protein